MQENENSNKSESKSAKNIHELKEINKREALSDNDECSNNETVNTKKHDELLMRTLSDAKKNTNKPVCVKPRSDENPRKENKN